METAGVAMLAAVAVLLLATALPAWIVLIGVAFVASCAGIAAGVFSVSLLEGLPSRLVGLFENDLLQALPLYVLMGAMLNRLPLADTLFRVLGAVLARTRAGAPLAGFILGALLAPMNGSVGASIATLSRTVYPRLRASGVPEVEAEAQVCVASTLGVVVPPSLVLILLGDAMLRAHTEAVNITHQAVRIVNTQDVFRGALGPAAILFAFYLLVTGSSGRRGAAGRPVAAPAAPRPGEVVTTAVTFALIVGLLVGVTLGYLYAVEAAATGAVVLFVYGMATRAMSRTILEGILRDTMAISGALFALLVGSTVFTLLVRAFGTDRYIAAALTGMGGGTYAALAVVLGALALCALVLDAFEMIFVVIPVVMPPLLTRVPDATWVSVLTLLILQASFMIPPFGYAVLMMRNSIRSRIATVPLARAVRPYLLAQIAVLCGVLAWPRLVWHDAPVDAATAVPASSDDDGGSLQRQLERNDAAEPAPDSGK
jgi:TRAP-type mannitol/chloroaromatic compound transport system permease large subunit